MFKVLYFFFISLLLAGCSNEPSNRDLQNIANSQISNLISIINNDSLGGLSISKITGVKDLKIDGIEKIQCIPEIQNPKIYACDVLVKYEILTSQNSFSELVGFSGKKSEFKKIRVFRGSGGWEIIN
jgi:hypothetical protein